MAGHLLAAGHEVTVHNRTRSREEPLAAAGAGGRSRPRRRRRGPRRCSRASRTRPTSSTSCSAPAASPRGSPPGAWSSTARRCRRRRRPRSRRRLRERGIGLVDAPVSGGSEGAERVRSRSSAAAPTPTSPRARPMLEAFGSRITHLGPSGAGQVAKAVNQVMIAGTYASVGEGIALAEAAGLDAAAARRGALGRGGGVVGAHEPRRQHDRRHLSARLQGRAAPQGSGYRPRRGRPCRPADRGLDARRGAGGRAHGRGPRRRGRERPRPPAQAHRAE